MRLVIWLNGAAAAINWITFAKTLDWWQLLRTSAIAAMTRTPMSASRLP
jgi:hypothetical protein